MSASIPQLASEPTEVGEQILIPGVRPLRRPARAAARRKAPAPRRTAAKPPIVDDEDVIRRQMNLFNATI